MLCCLHRNAPSQGGDFRISATGPTRQDEATSGGLRFSVPLPFKLLCKGYAKVYLAAAGESAGRNRTPSRIPPIDYAVAPRKRVTRSPDPPDTTCATAKRPCGGTAAETHTVTHRPDVLPRGVRRVSW